DQSEMRPADPEELCGLVEVPRLPRRRDVPIRHPRAGRVSEDRLNLPPVHLQRRERSPKQVPQILESQHGERHDSLLLEETSRLLADGVRERRKMRRASPAPLRPHPPCWPSGRRIPRRLPEIPDLPGRVGEYELVGIEARSREP